MAASQTINMNKRRLSLMLYWTVIFGLTHWPEIDRLAPHMPSNFDKLVHASMYAGWMAVWWWVLRAGGGRVTTATSVRLIAAGAVYAIFDELTQAIVGRQPDVADFLCDLTGLVVAAVVLHAWQRRKARRRSTGASSPASIKRVG